MNSTRVKPWAFLLLCLYVVSLAPQASASVPAAASAQTTTAERIRPFLAATTFILASAAVITEVESDRAYSRYEKTANPSLMSSYYDSAERKRDLSTAALIGADICAVAFVLTYLSEKQPTEPEPGSVIIGLAVLPGGAAIQLRW